MTITAQNLLFILIYRVLSIREINKNALLLLLSVLYNSQTYIYYRLKMAFPDKSRLELVNSCKRLAYYG
jgi:hypothetical protein